MWCCDPHKMLLGVGPMGPWLCVRIEGWAVQSLRCVFHSCTGHGCPPPNAFFGWQNAWWCLFARLCRRRPSHTRSLRARAPRRKWVVAISRWPWCMHASALCFPRSFPRAVTKTFAYLLWNRNSIHEVARVCSRAECHASAVVCCSMRSFLLFEQRLFHSPHPIRSTCARPVTCTACTAAFWCWCAWPWAG